jgi:hypothetical protein
MTDLGTEKITPALPTLTLWRCYSYHRHRQYHYHNYHKSRDKIHPGLFPIYVFWSLHLFLGLLTFLLPAGIYSYNTYGERVLFILNNCSVHVRL